MMSSGKWRTRSMSPHKSVPSGLYFCCWWVHDKAWPTNTWYCHALCPLLYQWVIALHWTSLIYCLLFSLLGIYPFLQMSESLQTSYLYSPTQTSCHQHVFLLCSFIWHKASLIQASLQNVSRIPFWLNAIFEAWYFMGNLDEKHSWCEILYLWPWLLLFVLGCKFTGATVELILNYVSEHERRIRSLGF